MTLATFINKETAPIGSQPIQQEPSGFSDVLSKSFTSTLNNFNSNARARLIDNEESERAKAFQSIVGEKLDPTKASTFKPFEEPSAQEVLELGPYHIENMREEHRKQYIDQYVEELKQQEPEKYKDVHSREELEEAARGKANLSRREFEEAAKRSSGFTRFTASLLGGLGATALDPLNIATLPFGAARGASILRTVAIEAAVNAGSELAVQPFVAKWQKELGQEYGFKEVAENVGFAALFGGSFAGVMKGAKPSAMFVFDKMSKMKNLKPSERLAANYMSKVAHLKEATPFVRNKTPLETRKHYDSVKAVSEAFENGKKAEPDDIRITEAEFNSIDTTPKRGDTQIEKARLAEVERFKESKPVFSEKYVGANEINRLKDPLNKAEETSLQNLINEKQSLSAIEANPQPFNAKQFRGEGKNVGRARFGEGIYSTPNKKEAAKFGEVKEVDISLERPYYLDSEIEKASFKPNADKLKKLGYDGVVVLDEKGKVKEVVDFDTKPSPKTEPTVNKDVLEPDFMDRVLDESNSPQFIQAEDINFRALAEENPDLLISLEDGEFRIGELLEQFDNDDNFIKQITTCTLG